MARGQTGRAKRSSVTVGLALAVGLLAGGVAWAEPILPRITVHASEAESGSERAGERVAAVEAAAGEALGSDSRFQFRALSSLLEPGVDVPRLLDEADRQVVEAEQAFGEMDLEKAKQRLMSAIDAYRRYLPELAARASGAASLRDAYVRLAKVRFFDGDKDGTREALRAVFALDMTFAYSAKALPAQMKKMVLEAKQLANALGGGKLSIDSDPEGAEVWLNGVKLEKPTPTEVAAMAGPNFLNFRLRGHLPAFALAEVKGKGDSSTAVQALQRAANDPGMGFAPGRLDERGAPPPELQGTLKALGLDMILLFRFGRPPDGAAQAPLTGYLYDARPNRILKRAERAVPEAELPAAARELTRELTRELASGARAEGILLPKVARAPSEVSLFFGKVKRELVAFHHWRGFWYVALGVAGAVVIGAAVGAGVSAWERQRSAQAVVLFGGSGTSASF